MLSFLYRLVRTFHVEHGFSPNVVVMSSPHYRKLVASIPGMKDYSSVTRFLRMEIILSEDCVHPHVAWLARAGHASRTG